MENSAFQEAYSLVSKNDNQKKAVDTTEGPLLVIAGPGTGKTQLLSVRVGKILQNNPTILPNNILCLTFTETGASNMRDRLTRFIGKDAYNVTISTYHAFGDEIIRRYAERFTDISLQNAIDDIGKHQIISEIVQKIPYSSPLRSVNYRVGDVISTISDIKRALLSSDDLRNVAQENIKIIDATKKEIAEIFANVKRMPSKIDKAEPLFKAVSEVLKSHLPDVSALPKFGNIAEIAIRELDVALEQAESLQSTKPLTAWKNAWLTKDSNNNFILDGEFASARLSAFADVYDNYQKHLNAKGLYDFDDMILRAISLLETNDDIKFSLQEQYQYILLDEFQDTNASQLKLVQLMTDNPVHEGKPNVMAVGDDDQAIYAFQGAQYSNMVDFYHLYREVEVVNLTHNYRSHENILHVADNITSQIESRVFTQLSNATKQLIAANKAIPNAEIDRHEFNSDIAQYDWIASQIEEKIASGIAPSEIAVLAPKHRYLEPLVACLNARNVPAQYEKRENILTSPLIKQFISMLKLLNTLANNQTGKANALWPEVLSYPFWQIPTSTIWQLSWEVSDSKHREWSKILLNSDNQQIRSVALLFLGSAFVAQHERHEVIFDYLIGNASITTNESDLPQVTSPFKNYYLGEEVRESAPDLFYDTISQLTVLRAKCQAYQNTQENVSTIADILNFINLYTSAEQQMLNTTPHMQHANAVQIMTVFKAKGLEFEHVYLPACQDEVWGGAGGARGNNMALPKNLAPIRHDGGTDDERLRVFFVAVTRARYGLHLTSYTSTYSGKNTKRLRYLNEQLQEDDSVKTLILPEPSQEVLRPGHEPPTLENLEHNWQVRHRNFYNNVDLFTLLKDRLQKYRLSPTDVTSFIDVQYGGPEAFFFNSILKFPQAPSVSMLFGNTVHSTLEWIQYSCSETQTLPTAQEIEQYFEKQLAKYNLPKQDFELEKARGTSALKSFITQRGSIFAKEGKAEVSLRNDNILIGDALMTGKIDRLEIDRENKTLTIVDYKTGKSPTSANDGAKLHKYTLQLYCYAIMLSQSKTYQDYTVKNGRLEFIEPNKESNIDVIDITFEHDEMLRVKELLQSIWKHVQELNFPDTSGYPTSKTGILAFEKKLLEDMQ